MMEFKRKRPAGMITFVLGLVIVGVVGHDVWEGETGRPGDLAVFASIGVGLLVAGVLQFGQPHRITLSPGGAVDVAPRFGRARTWRVRRLVPRPSEARVMAEVLVPVALLQVAVFHADPGLLWRLLVLGLIYGCWRRARRVDLVDPRSGRTRRINVEPMRDGDLLCEALAQRAGEARPPASEAAAGAAVAPAA